MWGSLLLSLDWPHLRIADMIQKDGANDGGELTVRLVAGGCDSLFGGCG
jgi:hypothetical protein